MLRTLIALTALGFSIPVAMAAPKSGPTDEQVYERQCADVLNFLPRIVRPDAVAALPPNAHVSLHSICTGVPLEDFGNAAGLGHQIAANPAMAAALARNGLSTDNVVAIEIDGNSAQLYVHQD
ncbi:MAG TPA: hypothetical protein VHZ56_04610 [Devosia sp.]|jgi:hypothetical protein|nr:hypothetical protein [Devosia sp.]